ncbi:O-antigen ligase family protein [Paenibacillus sabinae]|uniref:O-antigen ligase-related domain-containing protein n=1 Tax=Paenibacillus sabinae T27 TaxID=1268072 RepID=X4ZV19_9BACL|nr:O-antigen ligase family protein [Paenibacillus sabinae]AHV96158.1 hypothetical protein PSAB_06110 [Paenibacillus sabinae T27]
MKKFTLYFFVLFLFSSLYLTEKFNSLGSIAISIVICIIFPFVIMSKKEKIKVHSSSLFLIYGFLTACGISSLYNADIKIMLNAGIFFLLYLSSMSVVPSYEKVDINKTIFNSILISQLPIIILPIIISGVNTIPYRGIFYNPNSFGSVVSVVFVTLLSIVISKIERIITKRTDKRGKRNLVFHLLSMFLLFFLVILSGSRTSTLAAGLSVIAGALFLTLRLIKARKFWSSLIKTTFFSFLGAVVLYFLARFTPFYNYLYLNILYKFERKSMHGDVLDERGFVWARTLKEAGLWGRGSAYFSKEVGVTAHNTFINILGETGWVSLLIFIAFLILISIASFKYAISEIDDQYKYLPLLLLICFLFSSIGENMLFKVSMIAMFFSMGSIIDFRKKLVNKEKEHGNPIDRKIQGLMLNVKE